MNIDLKDLYLKQAELDKTIADNHNIDYPSTHRRRTLALLVELGELANTTRCFKFWSNKGPEEKERILDEYADGLHFILSLGIELGIKQTDYYVEDDNKDLTDALLATYEAIIELINNNSIMNYFKAMYSYLLILYKLGFTYEEAHEAYLKKLQVNYHRQETNY